jgi:hypothetical protein
MPALVEDRSMPPVRTNAVRIRTGRALSEEDLTVPGPAAALIAAAERPANVGAVMSWGGRPDLTGYTPPRVQAPSLFIVGGTDAPVIDPPPV